MKRYLLSLLLLIIFPLGGIRAQSNKVQVVRLFEIPSPYGYMPGYLISWSPDSSLVALNFALIADQAQPRLYHWQVYDVATGSLISDFQDIIGWSADSQRLIVRQADNGPLQLVDAHSGGLIATLQNAGNSFTYDFAYWPGTVVFDDVIPNLDSTTQTLRFYDGKTGAVEWSLEHVSQFPSFTRDKARFSVDTLQGVQVYSADYRLIDAVDGYLTPIADDLPWSPDGLHLLLLPQTTESYLGPLSIWTPVGSLSASIEDATGAAGWSPDSSQVAVPGSGNKVHFYDPEGHLQQTISGYPDGPTHIIGWQDHDLIARSGEYSDGGFTLSIWDTDQQRFAFQDQVDGSYVAHIHGDILDLYEPFIGLRQIDLTTGKVIKQAAFEQVIPYRSPDGRWLTGYGWAGVDAQQEYLYRSDPFEAVAQLDPAAGNFLGWSPDSRHFASIDDQKQSVVVWEIIEE